MRRRNSDRILKRFRRKQRRFGTNYSSSDVSSENQNERPVIHNHYYTHTPHFSGHFPPNCSQDYGQNPYFPWKPGTYLAEFRHYYPISSWNCDVRCSLPCAYGTIDRHLLEPSCNYVQQCGDRIARGWYGPRVLFQLPRPTNSCLF